MTMERLTPRIPDEIWFAENGHLVSGGAAEPPAFTELVAPVSARSGEPLNARGRKKCLRAFNENGPAFGRLVEKALADEVRNPAGLLIRLVETWPGYER